MNKNTLTYVFGSGRTRKIKESNYKAKEFFILYFTFLKKRKILN